MSKSGSAPASLWNRLSRRWLIFFVVVYALAFVFLLFVPQYTNTLLVILALPVLVLGALQSLSRRLGKRRGLRKEL